ncbi:MAG TPA: DUF4255 domain-containing protein [Ilumatobacteraceae bacterium]|jgi:hypothetical protein
MIHEVDETLLALIKQNAVDSGSIEVSFEAPTREWAAKRTKPTINVYLYDIREDVSRREVFYQDVRDETGKVIERRQPPRFFRLTYLITAWTQRPEDEHRLLSNLLQCFLRQDYLPPELLVGSLKEAGRVVVAAVAMPVGQERQISEVWSALGGELKPSLDLAIMAPMDTGKTQPVGAPVTEAPRFVVARPDAEPEPVNQGGAHKKGSPAAVAAAKAAAAAAIEPDTPASTSPPSPGPWQADETVRAGRQNDPGRVVRMRHRPEDRPGR